MSTQPNETPMKRCTRCGEMKPATGEHFYRDKNRKDGLYPLCKACRYEEESAYRAKHADAIREKRAAYLLAHPGKTKEYYAARREKALAYAAAYYAEHRDKVLARDKAYRVNNADKMKAYRAATRDRLIAYAAAYRAANPDKEKARHAKYSTTHRDKVNARTHRRRANKRALLATFTPADWERCLEYFGYCCAYCGRPRGLWHTLSQDHYIPLSRGGAYTVDNILPACYGAGGCNNSKNNCEPHEWLASKFGARKAARIEREIGEYFTSLEERAS